MKRRASNRRDSPLRAAVATQGKRGGARRTQCPGSTRVSMALRGAIDGRVVSAVRCSNAPDAFSIDLEPKEDYPRTRAVMAESGIDLAGPRSESVRERQGRST
jgi:hypothetical protein